MPFNLVWQLGGILPVLGNLISETAESTNFWYLLLRMELKNGKEGRVEIKGSAIHNEVAIARLKVRR